MLSKMHTVIFQELLDNQIQIMRTQLEKVLQEDIVSRIAQPAEIPNYTRGKSVQLHSHRTPDQQNTIEELDQRLSHLEQIREWLVEDPTLMTLIDETIGQKVKRAGKRQQRVAIFLSIVSLLLGRLLSLITPSMLSVLAQHFLH